MVEYYKVARPDGWDFYTGDTINYRDNIGKRVVSPEYFKGAKCCSAGVIHASKEPLDALKYGNLPCSVYCVSGRPVDKRDDKAGFKSFGVLNEVPESELPHLFGFDYYRAAYPVNPLEIDSEVTEQDIDNFREWASVRASVWASVWASVKDSVGASVGASVRASVWASVRASVWASVRASVGASVRASVWDSVEDSMWAYIGSCFPGVKEWKYIDHEPGKYPFQSCVDLWERGFIPIYMKSKWHLWKQNGGIVYTMESD